MTLDWFTNNTCEGSPSSTSGNFPLANGTVDATAFAKGPLAAGLYAFRGHYLGSTTYGPRTVRVSLCAWSTRTSRSRRTA